MARSPSLLAAPQAAAGMLVGLSTSVLGVRRQDSAVASVFEVGTLLPHQGLEGVLRRLPDMVYNLEAQLFCLVATAALGSVARPYFQAGAQCQELAGASLLSVESVRVTRPESCH